MKLTSTVIKVLAVTALTSHFSAARAAVFTITDLDGLGGISCSPPCNTFPRLVEGSDSFGTGVNNGGIVAGTSFNTNNDARAFVSHEATLTDLGIIRRKRELCDENKQQWSSNRLFQLHGQHNLARLYPNAHR